MTLKKQALTNLKDTYKSGDLLIPALKRHVMRQAEQPSDRRSDVMHPSEMCKPDWCLRRDFYRITGTKGKETQTNPSFHMENVYTEGHRIHHKYQTWLWEMGVLFGSWQCKSCQHTWFDTAPLYCPECDSPRIRYREIPLVNQEMHVAGHADGAVLDGGLLDLDEPVLIEIKSVGHRTLAFEAPHLYHMYEAGESLDRIWHDISRPFPSHIKQATLYCWLSKKPGSVTLFDAAPFYKKMVFIYECKWNQQVKEFVVTPNFEHINHIIEGAKDVAYAIKKGTEPDRPTWATSEHGTCTKCSYRDSCWGERPPPSSAPSVSVQRVTAGVRRRALR